MVKREERRERERERERDSVPATESHLSLPPFTTQSLAMSQRANLLSLSCRERRRRRRRRSGRSSFPASCQKVQRPGLTLSRTQTQVLPLLLLLLLFLSFLFFARRHRRRLSADDVSASYLYHWSTHRLTASGVAQPENSLTKSE